MLLAEWYSTGLLNFAIFLIGIFLVLLILIQRGKGGGLIGALGGTGGSSPFGSRAGDTMTRWTLYLAGMWILLLIFQIYALKPEKPVNQPPAANNPNQPQG